MFSKSVPPVERRMKQVIASKLIYSIYFLQSLKYGYLHVQLSVFYSISKLENCIHQLHGSDVNSLWILISGLHFTVGSYNSIGSTLLHHNGSAMVVEYYS